MWMNLKFTLNKGDQVIGGLKHGYIYEMTAMSFKQIASFHTG